VDTSEEFADGLVSRGELKAIRRTVGEALSDADCKAAWEAAGVRAWEAAVATQWRLAPFQEDLFSNVLLQDVFGNPFRPLSVDPSWLIWNSGTVQKVAQAIYDERAFDRLPVLADALEEAGCTNLDILDHCRQPGEHVRGCWVVDLLYGKK
jgi:hypothetical protein